MLRFVTITLRSWGYYITNYYFRIKVPWGNTWANYVNCWWSEAMHFVCWFTNLELNSTQRKIYLFSVELNLLWTQSLASYFVIFENFWMSLLALPVLDAHPLSGSNFSEILPCLVKARAIIFLMQRFNSETTFFL